MRPVEAFAFQDVFTDDTCISDATDGHFEIAADSTHAVRIMKSADGSCP